MVKSTECASEQLVTHTHSMAHVTPTYRNSQPCQKGERERERERERELGGRDRNFQGQNPFQKLTFSQLPRLALYRYWVMLFL